MPIPNFELKSQNVLLLFTTTRGQQLLRLYSTILHECVRLMCG